MENFCTQVSIINQSVVSYVSYFDYQGLEGSSCNSYPDTILIIERRKPSLFGSVAFTKRDGYDQGILDDEPDLFTIFSEYVDEYKQPGIYALTNSKLDQGGEEPKPGDEESKEYDINGMEGFAKQDMANTKTFTIKCPKSTILIIHYCEGFIAEAFSNGAKFGTINNKSPNKIINFGNSDGEVVFKKDESASKLLADESSQIEYSFMVMSSVKAATPWNIDCNEMLISTETNTNFKIGGPDYQGNKNYSLPSSSEFCLWFSSPIKLISAVNYYLPHYHYVSVDGNLNEISSTSDVRYGNSFLYLLSQSGVTLNNKYATYEVVKDNGDEDTTNKYENFEQIIKVSHNNEVIGSNAAEDETKPEPNDGGDDNLIIIIVVVVVVVVVVIVIIIVVSVVCVKKKRKIKSNSSEEASP